MSVFDIIVFTVFIALTLRGVWKGMISQIVSVGSYFVCWLVASRFAFIIAPSIPAEEPWNQVGAMAVLFVITLAAVRFFRTVLETFVKQLHLEGLNKLLGGGLGFLKAVLICMVLTFFAVMLSEASRSVVFQSQSGQYFITLITKTSAFVPKDSYELLREQLDKFNVQTGTGAAAQGQNTASPDAVLNPKAETSSQSLSHSLFDAVANWWNGTTKEVTESVTDNLKETIVQGITKNLPVQAETFKNVFQSVSQSVSDFTAAKNQEAEIPHSVLEPVKPVIDDLFTARTLNSPALNPPNNAFQPLVPLSALPIPAAVSADNAQRITAEQILNNAGYNPAPPVSGSTGAVRYRKN
ncbi:MAG: CvpA family protein [Planctomycetaceae bacterium]|jgi:membrane protein required for colicin V production|nr:CvpA family protein [Planctomycetaceae bacterium]